MHNNLPVVLRYAAVGGASVALYVGGSAFLHRALNLDPVLASTSSYVLATLLNYLANFYWAFNTTRSHASASWRFLVVVLAGILLNWAYTSSLLKLTQLPLEIIAISFALIWPLISFVCLRIWALR